MPRIGVLSDTHVQFGSSASTRMLQLSAQHFADVDLIFHAGDLTDPALLTCFVPPVYAVRGNLDPPDLQLPQQRILEVGGWRFGLIHGWGSPAGLVQRIRQSFAGESLDCIVFGHSHFPYNQRHGGTLFFNPGSPVDRRSAPFHSLGIIEAGSTLNGRIVSLD